jgi:hypothetical protein
MPPDPRASESPERTALAAAGTVALASWALVVWRGAHLLHYDARAHLVVARRVLDSLTPGWIQLGAVWLPLPQILNVLPAHSDFLYRTGLFAALLGLAAFLLGLFALARAARIATGDAGAAVVALAVPALNPGWLYLEATPLTEPLFLGLVGGLALFVVRWRQERRQRDLVLAALFSALASLVRYEAWPIVVAAAVAAFWRLPPPAPDARTARRGMALLLGVGLVAPIVLFALHSWVSTHRILYVIDERDLSRPRGDLPAAVLLLASGIGEAFGVPVALLGLASLAVLALRLSRSGLVPLALAGSGVVTLSAYLAGHPDKARYPLLLAPALALAIAVATAGRRTAQLAALAVAATQPLSVPVLVPVIAEALRSRPDELAARPEMEAFRRAYRGGGILASLGSNTPLVFDLQLPIREIVHEGNGNYWDYAAVDPARHVEWVLTAPGDILDEVRAYRPRFPEGFVAVGRIGRVTVYGREGSRTGAWSSNQRAESSATLSSAPGSSKR